MFVIEIGKTILNILKQKSKEEAKFIMSLIFYERDLFQIKKPLVEI